jgi:lipoprotein-releasing system permease protein
MLPFAIAWRFVRTSRAQSALIIVGIAVGIAVQVFVGSLITSLQASLVNTTIGSSPHITLADPKDGQPVVYSDRMKRVLAATAGVSAIAPTRQVSVLYSNGTDKVPLTVKGGTLAALNDIYHLAARTVNGVASLRAGEVVIGKDLAAKYSLLPGDPLNVDTGTSQTTLRISGVVDLGSSAANLREAFTGPEFPRAQLGYSADQYSAIEIQLRDPFTSKGVSAAWTQQLQGVKVSDWQVENKDLLAALQSQSGSSYLIQVFVLVAVALGIASTLAISAVQKTRQIGILKALGMTDASTGRIFFAESVILGVSGTGLGVVLGYLLIGGFTAGTQGSPSAFPIVPQPTFILVSACIGVLVALLSSLIPIRRTTRLDPIEVIQNG